MADVAHHVRFVLERICRDLCGMTVPCHAGHAGADFDKPSTSECDGTYERPADACLSGSMSDCAEKGFVRNAMHPESSAALRTAGSSFPVM